MNSVVKQYCTQVGRQLHCMPRTRKQILKGLAENLAELPAKDRESLGSLERSYGSVMQTVMELQETVNPEEQYATLRKRQIRSNILLVAFMVLSLFFAGAIVVRQLQIPLSPKIAYYLPLRQSGGSLLFTDLEEANRALQILGADITIEPEKDGRVFQSCSIKTVLFFLNREGSVEIGDSEITDASQLKPDVLHTVYQYNVIYNSGVPIS